MAENLMTTDYLFETSWEVCNKVGGVHTVLSTKATEMVSELESNYILIGPDVWREDTKDHPEFIEDPDLFKVWRENAQAEGIRIHVGRWKIPGNPIAVLVDFTPFISQKDAIFSKFWEGYKLDSLSGQWDYIEPALFGYAAARVIESFVRYKISPNEKVVAQFHEWMTGTGVLYLKSSLPQVGTVFTTHSTVVGRSIAGSNKPLYKHLESYNGEESAKEYNIISKQSLEKLSAQNADVTTTVSEITARECAHFHQKEIDIITPNGFDEKLVPGKKIFTQKRNEARQKLLEVAEALTGNAPSKNAKIVMNSGRYEFNNKGTNIYLDALAQLRNQDLKDDILAFVLIPAGHNGPSKELLTKLNGDKDCAINNVFTTHNLNDPETDPILNKIKDLGFTNSKDEKIKIIFVPSYLREEDGIFNIPYYDVLIGADLTIFPSYYEPWGYTPHESLAFSIPTITSTLTGFGALINNLVKDKGNAITIVERNDDNYTDAVDAISKAAYNFFTLSADKITEAREKALEISKLALWKNLSHNYYKAYSIALTKVDERSESFKSQEQTQSNFPEVVRPYVNEPNWTRMMVQSGMPEKLKKLEEISNNLWWCWNIEATEILECIDPEIWEKCGHNPAILFEEVDYERLTELEKDQKFMKKLNAVHKEFKTYMDSTNHEGQAKIAYFSMEYGLHDSLKIFSGGLGLLAGDYLKEASDSNYNLVAVGLLYRYGYFKQIISISGEQMVGYDYQHFSKLPVTPVRDDNGNIITVSIMLPGRTMHARIWQVNVGRIKLYLLDTDYEANIDQDRFVTHHLYGGDNENRLKQELLLGIGGIRLLNTLGIKPDLFHSNEGHSAFIGVERLGKYINEQNMTFSEAKEIVRASTLFTTHTPVPAGHDSFTEDLLRTYIAHYPQRLKISWEDFMNLGRANANDWGEKFNMSHLAANLSQEVNGVSMLHGKVSQDMFAKLWKGYLPEELHISYVTNGVHLETWLAKPWRDLFKKQFGEDFFTNQLDFDRWEKIKDVPDETIWTIRQSQREKLITAIKERYKEASLQRFENPKDVIKILDQMHPETLTIGFARRFATYKRAHLLFTNPERLAQILNNPEKPVQFLFAGKAHPHDKMGQDLIKMIIELSKKPEFQGKILFLQNYDITLAQKLVQGVDIWMNTPTRPLEASGTSGEKAVMNGALHFSVLDGWWVEGYKKDAGWMLPQEKTYDNQQFQDELDAETIYSILENEVVPAFYNRNVRGIPTDWVGYIKNSISGVSPNFTTKRMITDYYDRFYNKLSDRTMKMRKNDYQMAIELSDWKRKIAREWDRISVISADFQSESSEAYTVGKKYSAEVILDLNDLSPGEIGVEAIITENKSLLIDKIEFEMSSFENGQAKYSAIITPTKPGSYSFGLRIFPKNSLLPHRQDMRNLRWI